MMKLRPANCDLAPPRLHLLQSWSGGERGKDGEEEEEEEEEGPNWRKKWRKYTLFRSPGGTRIRQDGRGGGGEVPWFADKAG